MSGHVEPSGRGGMSALKALDEHAELHVLGLIMQQPELYLGEICHELHLTCATVNANVFFDFV